MQNSRIFSILFPSHYFIFPDTAVMSQITTPRTTMHWEHTVKSLRLNILAKRNFKNSRGSYDWYWWRIDHGNDITFNAMQGNSQRTWEISVTFPVNRKHRVSKCQLGHSLKLVGFTPGVGKRDRGIETGLKKAILQLLSLAGAISHWFRL